MRPISLSSSGKLHAASAKAVAHGLTSAHGPEEGHGPPPVRRLLALVRWDSTELWVAVAYGAGVGLFQLAIPIAVQSLVNTVAFGTLLQPLVVLALLVLAGLLLAGGMRALQAHLIEVIARRLFARVALDLSWRLPRVRAAALDGAHGPELVNRFFDVLTLQKGAAALLLDGLAVALGTAAGLLLLALYHPVLLGFGLVLALAMLGVLFGLGRGATATSIEESKAKYEVAAWLEEVVRHPATFRSRAGEELAAGRALHLIEDYLGARQQHYRVVLRQMVGGFGLQALASAGLLGVGGYLVIARQLTLGQLVAAELVVTAAVASFAKLWKVLESYYDLLAAVDKLGHLTDLPVDPRVADARAGAALPAEPRGAALRLCGVGYRFAEGRGGLRGLDIEIHPGERVVLLGGHGAGKSLVADLVAGVRLPSEGRIEIDGLDVRDVHLESLREQVLLVRGAEIFAGTVAENLSLGRADVGPAEMRTVLEAVGLWEEIAALPEGLGTMLATGGAPLSVGQARRLVVARALVLQPRLLVIDDLGTFDTALRHRVWRALTDRHAPWTLVLTAHAGEWIGPVDRVIQLAGAPSEAPVRQVL
ncbi:MAG TPA: ABC transporter ATP-binding protein [Polyangia bacterium]|nr:ABC transporter ATP-binding protein [Polyangia bacterium]